MERKDYTINDYARMSIGVIPFSERLTEDKTKSAIRSDYLFYPKDGAKVQLFDGGVKQKESTCAIMPYMCQIVYYFSLRKNKGFGIDSKIML